MLTKQSQDVYFKIPIKRIEYEKVEKVFACYGDECQQDKIEISVIIGKYDENKCKQHEHVRYDWYDRQVNCHFC